MNAKKSPRLAAGALVLALLVPSPVVAASPEETFFNGLTSIGEGLVVVPYWHTGAIIHDGITEVVVVGLMATVDWIDDAPCWYLEYTFTPDHATQIGPGRAADCRGMQSFSWS